MLKRFSDGLVKNLIACFSGYNLLWHALAIVGTAILVVSEFDWFYFEHTRNTALLYAFLPASVIGGLMPIVVPLTLFIRGRLRKDLIAKNTAYALAQASAIAWLVSSFFQAYT